MKSEKLKLLENVLRIMAVTILKRHKPKVVAITGSVGKTSTKDAVFAVLSSRFNVRQNQKNYNNEIGIPLTIIGAESGGGNIFLWFLVVLKWIVAIIFPKYPEIIILELGVDRPDDMKYFMSFVRPTISIVTNVSVSHIEFFKSIENIAKEKRIIIEMLKPGGVAILNADDERVFQMSQNTKEQVITFGQTENANVNASHLIYNYVDGKPEGISFKLNYEGKNIPIRLRNILAGHYIYAAMAAATVGIAMKINLVEIASALESLRSPVGRMNLLEGINKSYIIDDTYNASPISTIAALSVLQEMQATRKIAVLGDMLELGDQLEKGHRDVGEKIFSAKIDFFVAVGKRMGNAVAQLIAMGYPAKNIFHFKDPDSAAEKVAELADQGDFILVKGSQGMRMEKVVEKIIANPDEAKNLLCRQSSQWRKKPFVRP